MKYLLWITLLLPLSTLWADPGDPVFLRPRIWNSFNSVEVDLWNTSDVDVECSGNVRIYTRSGRTQYEYYWEVIYRGFSNSKRYYLWDNSDQIMSAYDTINCRER